MKESKIIGARARLSETSNFIDVPMNICCGDVNNGYKKGIVPDMNAAVEISNHFFKDYDADKAYKAGSIIYTDDKVYLCIGQTASQISNRMQGSKTLDVDGDGLFTQNDSNYFKTISENGEWSKYGIEFGVWYYNPSINVSSKVINNIICLYEPETTE